MNGISSHFIHAFVLARSRMGLLPVIFQKKKGGGGAQWLSGRVLDLRQRGSGFEPHGVTGLCP